jgi:hypothetical protein
LIWEFDYWDLEALFASFFLRFGWLDFFERGFCGLGGFGRLGIFLCRPVRLIRGFGRIKRNH